MKKSIEAFNRSPWYLQVIIGLVGLAVAVALAIPLSWLVEILWGYVLQLITIVFKWISSWMPAGKLFSWKAVFDAVPKIGTLAFDFGIDHCRCFLRFDFGPCLCGR